MRVRAERLRVLYRPLAEPNLTGRSAAACLDGVVRDRMIESDVKDTLAKV